MPNPECDLLVTSRWLLPIAPANVVIDRGAVAVAGGRIVAVGTADALSTTFRARERIDLADHALLPGLVNAHGHAAMSLLRGAAEDLPLQAWLTDHIWPREAAFVDPDFVLDGTRLAISEMIATGTTCFADMYFFPESAARAVNEAGVRAQLAFPIVRFANPWSSGADEAFHKGLALFDAHRADPSIAIAFGPHSAYTVGPAELEKTLMYAEELDAHVHIHLHENAQEVREAHEALGHSWIEELARLGLLGPSLQAVDMTSLTEAEIELIADRGVHVVHCPHSNLKLASGMCPTHKLADKGVSVCIGTDGAASNNGLDLFAETRLAALLMKHQAGDAAAGDAATMLRMATLTGAQALGFGSEIGSLEPGKSADLIAVDLGAPGLHPVYAPMSNLVHGPAGAAVSHVWVAGRLLLDDGEHTTIDVCAARARAREWRERMA
jgi:5-methylthioadenosine/S-adenosylhomocysteine deaminase